MSELIGRYVQHGGEVSVADPPQARTVVVVPHPDDEVLAFGGTLCRQFSRKLDVVLLAVTDGEAAYGSSSCSMLAAVRRREQLGAVRRLGSRAADIVRFGLPDGKVDEHEDQLVDFLSHWIRPHDFVIAPWIHDWHPDHEAVGRAVNRAVPDSIMLWSGIVWGHFHPERAKQLEGSVIGVRLTPSEQIRRAVALEEHASQHRWKGKPGIIDRELMNLAAAPCEYFTERLPR